jgi:hypothetical protein
MGLRPQFKGGIMKLENLQSIKESSISAFARAHGQSRQVIAARIKHGWMVGNLNGVPVMYNPNQIQQVVEGWQE